MTGRDATVTIRFDGSRGAQQFTLDDVKKLIYGYMRSTHYAQAASASMQVAEQLPRDPWPHLVAAEALYLHQQIEPAFRYIDRVLDLDPRNIAGHVVKSRLCLYSGNHADAIMLLNAALQLAPRSVKLYCERGALLADIGDVDGARDAYLRCIQLDASDADALLGLSRLPGDNFSDALINEVGQVLRSRQMPAEAQAKAHFALAHAYDKKGDVAAHFEHLSAGNELKNRSVKFDPVASRDEAQRIVDVFSADFFAQRRGTTGNPAKLIFIVGFPRCGSTLVEQILSSHPAVSAAGEIFALTHATRHFQQSRGVSSPYPDWVETQTADALNEIADDYVRKVKGFNRTTYLTDKMLDNYRLIGLIHLIFPEAKVISVQRNPIDVCYSCYKQCFNHQSVPYTYSLENLASRYRDYRRVMRHWGRVLPGRIHTVEYEQLVDRQEQVTRNLLQHCGLDWDDACLEFHSAPRTVQTNSNIQVRQPLYADSIARWKTRERYLGPLLELTND